MKKDKLKYASVNNPVIAAAIQGLYSFTNQIQAKKFLKQIIDHHIISKVPEKLDNEATMWIKGYELSEEQKYEGYKGNFGIFRVVQKDRTKFTIAVEKIEVEIKNHPVREYKKKDNPNWGHPVLRAIKKKKIYNKIEDAQRDLLFLQEEFPMVSIPAAGKLYTMIYEKVGDKSKVNKYVLELQNTPEGKYFISFKLNDSKKTSHVTPSTKSAEPQAVGEFTSKILLKRNKKKK